MKEAGAWGDRQSGPAGSFASVAAAFVLLVGLVAAPSWLLGLMDPRGTGFAPALELGLLGPPAAAAQSDVGSTAGAGPRPAAAHTPADSTPTTTPSGHVVAAPLPPHHAPAPAIPGPAAPVSPVAEVTVVTEGMLDAVDPPAAAAPPSPGQLVASDPPEAVPAPVEDTGDAVQDRGDLEQDAGDRELAALPDSDDWWADPDAAVSRLLARSGIAPQ